MRAREPDAEGFVDRHGLKLHYEVFGDGRPTMLLLPTWTIVHARFWKAQVPYLARHFRVVTYDGRHYWLDHYQDFLEFFFSQCFTEPHSTKPIEDSVGWGLETSPEVLIAEDAAPWVDKATLRGWWAASRIPMARDPVQVNLLIREFVESMPEGRRP
jgi:pimeloyl-ACP methyl ester carboxylesterase